MFKTFGVHFVRFGVTTLCASVIIFALLRLVPGDPAAIALGVNATPEALAAKQRELGTDRSLILQYFSWIIGVFTAHFGISLNSGQEITTILLDRLSVSVILMLTAMAIALAISLPLGTWAAFRRRRLDGVLITGASQIGLAIPSFLTAIVLVSIFSVSYSWLPANGWLPPSAGLVPFASRLLLPAVSLASVQTAIMTRYTRTSVLEVMHHDFMRTARAKGLTPAQTLLRHGLRSASLPIVTVTGVQMSSLIVGAVVIEQVFSIPGLGSYLLDAVATRDFPVIQSVVMVLVLITVGTNFIVDLSYSLLDPRTRAEN